MPVPLSFALWAMNAVKKYHTAPAFERPIRLQRVYLGRVSAYVAAGSCGLYSYFNNKTLLRSDITVQEFLK